MRFESNDVFYVSIKLRALFPFFFICEQNFATLQKNLVTLKSVVTPSFRNTDIIHCIFGLAQSVRIRRISSLSASLLSSSRVPCLIKPEKQTDQLSCKFGHHTRSIINVIFQKIFTILSGLRHYGKSDM